MLIIYDGVDCSGKSYLANKHSESCLGYNGLPTPIVKKPFATFLEDNKFLKGEMIEVMSKFFIDTLFPIGKSTPIIVDRALLSSLVYSKYFNRSFDVTYIYDYLLKPENNQHIMLFLVTADEPTLRERFINRGEKLFTIEQILSIQDLFIEVANFLIEKGAPIQIIDNSNKELK